MQKNESLIVKLKFEGFDKKFEEQASSYASLDIRPNSKLNLFLYNNFSKKGKLKIGEAPHILDSSLVEVSRKQLERFLNTKGFLNAEVKSKVEIKNRRAEITYTALQGVPFSFNEITFDIKDTTVKLLYLKNRINFTTITKGARYDEDSIANEREKIYLLMKANGYYDFVRQYVRPIVDTNTNNSTANIVISILNPKDENYHSKYQLNNTFITIQSANSYSKLTDSTLLDSQYYFYDHTRFFKPKKIVDFIYLKKGDYYNINQSELTNQRLYELNVFKGINISFVKTSDSLKKLNTFIDIIPLKRKFNRIDGEYTFNSSITGLNLGLTFQNRNAFGGGEVFEIKLRGGLQFDRNISGNFLDRIISKDYQIGTSLLFPRLISPFKIPIIGRAGIAHTRVGINYQIFKLTNIYQRNTLSSNLSYDWIETRYKSHSFSPINIQYSLGNIKQSVADSLIAQGQMFFLSTLRSQIVSSSAYSYTYNNIRLTELRNFTYFFGNLEIGGNTAALLANAIGKTDELGQKRIFNVPYYQFAKTEADVRFYKWFGGDKQLVFRFNTGIGYSYGNVLSMPFEKLYFAGGSTGIRAWQARTLGPGNYNRASLKNDTTRLNLRNLDQLGDLKLEGNIEYRFKIANNFFGSKVKGATFVDYGNIWQLRKQDQQAARAIKLNDLWSQTAIGIGLGLRFDVSFFIFRLDAGIKFKDPQFKGSNQWVSKYWFNKSERKDFLNTYENVTNTPDKYSFTQVQFGIGMPF